MRYKSRTSRPDTKKFGGKPTAVKLHKESNKSKTPPRNYEFVVVKVSGVEKKDLYDNGKVLWKRIREQIEQEISVYKYFADVELEVKSAVFLVKRIEGKYQKPELTVFGTRKEGKLSWVRVPETIKLKKAIHV